MSPRLRRTGRILILLAALGLLAVLAASQWVRRSTAERLYAPQPLAAIPARDVAIVFGAGIRKGGALSDILADRVRTAAELYQAGRVRKLLMSGDNRRVGYDEPSAMRDFAVSLGVPARDIVLDYAGFRTYDTCVRASAIFRVRSAALVSQSYHLPRALYTIAHLPQGLGVPLPPVDAIAVSADRRRYARAAWYRVREQLSRAVAVLELQVLHPLLGRRYGSPHFLGRPEPIRLE